MSNNRNFRIIVSITIATVFGKVLGIAKDILISYYYGTSRETDAFFLALSIPTILLGVFTASTDSAIIPQYTRLMYEDSKKRADGLFFSILNTLFIICFICSTIICAFPNFFVNLFAPGFDKQEAIEASSYLRIFSYVGVLHMLYCFFCTYNAAHKQNVVRTILAFSTNFIIVCSLLVIRNNGLYWLAIVYLLANVVCGLLPVLEMKKIGFTYSLLINLKDEEYRKFWMLFLPIMGGALLNDLQQYVDKNLCSSISGGISYLNYGSKLINIFDSVLVVGIGVVLLPMLSSINARKDKKLFSTVSSKVTRYLFELLIPFFVLLYSQSTPLVTLLFGRGKFDSKSIEYVSYVLKAYSGLIVLMPTITIFSKYFHSMELNNIPFIISALAVAINTCLSIILKRFIGVQGVALATTIASFIEVILFAFQIEKRVSWDKNEIDIITIAKYLVPIAASFVATQLVERMRLSVFVSLLVSSAFIVAIFGGCYYLMFKDDFLFMFKKSISFVSKSR